VPATCVCAAGFQRVVTAQDPQAGSDVSSPVDSRNATDEPGSGSAAPRGGFVLCEPCPGNGSLKNETGDGPCACGLGYRPAATQQRGACEPCPLGTVASLAGGSRAVCLCAPGFYLGVSGTTCVRCPAASSKPDPGPQPCTCGADYTFEPATGQCAACPSGAFKPAAEGNTGRCRCGPGYTTITDGPSASLRCAPCAPGTWSSSVSAEACIPCHQGASHGREAATSRDLCECLAGFFPAEPIDHAALPGGATAVSTTSGGSDGGDGGGVANSIQETQQQFRFAVNGSACAPCADAVRCAGGRATRPAARAGFWIAEDAETGLMLVMECPADLDGACVDGGLCRDGHMGPLCGACAEGYGRLGRACELCRGATDWLGLIAILGVFCAIVVYKIRAAAGSGGTEEAAESTIASCSLDVVLDFLQAQSFMLSFAFDLPSVIVSMLRPASVSAAGAGNAPFECTIGWSRAWIAVWSAVLSLALLVIVVFSYYLYWRTTRGTPAWPLPHSAPTAAESAAARQPGGLAVSVCRGTLVALLWLLPAFSLEAISVFHCRNVAGVRLLSSDVTMQCDTPQHRWMMALSGLSIALVSIATPAAIAWRLWHAASAAAAAATAAVKVDSSSAAAANADASSSATAIATSASVVVSTVSQTGRQQSRLPAGAGTGHDLAVLGFLTGMFRPPMALFAIAPLARKTVVILCALLSGFSAGLAAFLVSAALVAELCLTVHHRPFHVQQPALKRVPRRLDGLLKRIGGVHTVAIACLVASLLTITAGAAFGDARGESRDVLTVVVLAVNVPLYALVFYAAGTVAIAALGGTKVKNDAGARPELGLARTKNSATRTDAMPADFPGHTYGSRGPGWQQQPLGDDCAVPVTISTRLGQPLAVSTVERNDPIGTPSPQAPIFPPASANGGSNYSETSSDDDASFRTAS
jgi:hypothetical protein